MRRTKSTRRWAALALAMAMTVALLAGCGKQSTPSSSSATSSSSASQSEFTPGTYSIGALKGPTAMGLVKLMSDGAAGETANNYTFSIAASADELTPQLIQGNLDMACVPANLAAVLYEKTDGDIQVVALNTLGVLYIVENGNAVQSMADLKGKTIVAAGKGSTPEYALRYLLQEYGIDPDLDVVIDWKSEHSECVSALATGAATIAMLPQPFVSVAQNTVENLRVALDLNQAWADLDNGNSMVTGVVVARKEVLEENPSAILTFLGEYNSSVEWVNANTDEAAQLIGDYDIVDAAVAKQALPHCNIVCIIGNDMKAQLSGYLNILYGMDPESVGGNLPDDNFYFGA